MTAPLQPATRRLLTEAAGDLKFRTAAQVTTEADARAAAAITAQKAQPSGLASLGADGKVPSGQLPPAAVLTVASYRATDVTLTASTTTPADVGLSVALTAGTWLLDAFLSLGGFQPYVKLFRDTASLSGRYGGIYAAGAAAGALSNTTFNSVGTPGVSGVTWLQLRGAAVLTAAKTCYLDVSASNTATLYAGSFLIATKIA